MSSTSDGEHNAKYVHFETLVDQLKRAAIDAWMCQEGWKIKDDLWYTKSETVMLLPSKTVAWCTRPGAGEHGEATVYEQEGRPTVGSVPGNPGDFYLDPGVFGTVRHDIEAIVAPWRALPDPAAIQKIEQRQGKSKGSASNASYQDIYESFIGENEKDIDDQSIFGRLQLIWEEFVGNPDKPDAYGAYPPAMEGDAADTYKTYLIELWKAISGCRHLAGILYTSVTAQRELWNTARDKVAKIIYQARQGFSQVADQAAKEGAWSIDDTLLLVSLITVAIGAPIALPESMVAVSTALGLTSAVTSVGTSIVGYEYSASAPPKPVKETYGGVMRWLRDMLATDTGAGKSGLNNTIYYVEDKLRSKLVDAIGDVDHLRSQFDPTPNLIDSPDKIVGLRGRDRIDNIIGCVAPDVSADIDKVVGQLSSCASECDPGPFKRDREIGIGRIGPTEHLLDLIDVLKRLLGELSWKVNISTEDLKDVRDLHLHVNGAALSKVRALEAEYEAGYQGGISVIDFSKLEGEDTGRSGSGEKPDSSNSGSGGTSKGGGAEPPWPRVTWGSPIDVNKLNE